MCKDCIYCSSDMDGGPPHECRKCVPKVDPITNNWAMWPEIPIVNGWCGEGIAKGSVKGEIWQRWANKVKESNEEGEDYTR